MHADRTRLRAGALSLFVIASVLMPTECTAQWVANPRHGYFSFGYQYTRITDHLFSQSVDGMVDPVTGYVGGPDNRYYMGDVYGQSINVSGSYGLWRGLAVSGGGTYVTSRYVGKSPEGPEDDGSYHGSLQNGNLSLAYMLSWKDFAITPSAGFIFPLTDYSTLGHTSVGKYLKEVPLGITVGRSLSPLLPRAFLSGSFSYSFVEDHHEHSLDQRHFAASGGYMVTNSVSIGGFTEYVDTIDGLDWYEDDLTGEEAWHDHDTAAKAEYVRVGGYFGYSVNRTLSFRLSYVDTVSGENTHDGSSLMIEPTWSF